MERATRLELATLSLGNVSSECPNHSKKSQAIGNPSALAGSRVQDAHDSTRFHKSFVPYVSQAPSLKLVRGGAENLLSVREVAEHLGVATYTVYRLCERGELAHVRISNAIRITPRALQDYIAKQTKR